VLELEVVTGRGEVLRCSPAQHRELFDTVRAGLGQVAVITRATLALVALPRQVRRCVLTYADLRSLLHDQRLLLAEGRFDQVQGAALAAPTGGWTFRLDAVKAFDGNAPDDAPLLAGLSDRRGQAAIGTMSALEHASRLAVLEQALRANGQWWHPHPWLTTFVGDSRVGDVVGGELATLEPTALGPFGQIGLSAFTRHAVRCPLLRLPADAVCWAFNLIRVPAHDDLDDAARLVADNRRIYERLRVSGGTLYPVSAFAMSRDDWRAHFGEAFHALAAAKQKFDPGAVLTPGYELF
jgi:cytokinin dehydrogenase